MKKHQSRAIFEDEGIPIGIVRLSILRGLGIDIEDIRNKPLIAICNTFTEFNPGHVHLRELAQKVKEGIWSAGGVPFEFGLPAPCDGVANGNDGMRFILAQRELLADTVETYIRSQLFDGLVTLSSCDKINPAMLMAAARLDIPTLCLPGGPGSWNIRFVKPLCTSVDHKDYEGMDKLQTATLATCGACEIMGTANTLQCLMEALGMALPRSANVPAYHEEKLRFARQAGRRIVAMIEEELTPRKIMTRNALLNAVIIDLAIGGSTNSTLHLPALAHALDMTLELDIFNEYNRKIPTLLGISPNGPHGIIDLYRAGGIPAVMKRLENDIFTDCITVTGGTVGDWIKDSEIKDDDVIPPRDNPHDPEGGTVVLRGSLAPDGAVVKQSAVAKDMRTFKGKAVVLDTEAEALNALKTGKIKDGDVMVIRYEGPRGAPGMPEILSVTMTVELMGLGRVALVTDGRFSGATAGPCVGHISPEAFEGGPIALVQDGDEISIDIPGRIIDLHVPEEELKRRTRAWKPLERPVPPGYMRRYRKLVSSASTGAVID